MSNTPTNGDELAESGSARPLTSRRMVAAARREARSAERATRRPSSSAPRRARGSKPFRTVGTLVAALALIAGVAIPAYAVTQGGATASASDSASVRDVASGDAQSFASSEDVQQSGLSTTDYSATTAEEIAQKKAEEEALERAKEQAAAAAAAASSTVDSTSTDEASGTVASASTATPVNGLVFPLPGGYTLGDGVGYHSGHYASLHEGQDLLIACGTPIYAAADGVVETAGVTGGYGNFVKYSSTVDGQNLTFGNGHMQSISVSVGQSITQGQVIGYVGSTGYSTACHLHLEIHQNGSLVYDVMGTF